MRYPIIDIIKIFEYGSYYCSSLHTFSYDPSTSIPAQASNYYPSASLFQSMEKASCSLHRWAGQSAWTWPWMCRISAVFACSRDRDCHLTHLSPAWQGPLCSCLSHRGVIQWLIIKSIISCSVKSEEILSCRSGVICHNFPQLEARGGKILSSLTSEIVSKQQLVKDCGIYHKIPLSTMQVLWYKPLS